MRFLILFFYLIENFSYGTSSPIDIQRKSNPERIRSLNGSLITGSLSNSLEKVNEALALGAEIDAAGSMNITALMAAVENNNLPIVQKLIKHGASCFEVNTDGETALHIATRKGQEDIVKILLASSKDHSDINQITEQGKTPLFIAIENGFTNLVRLFIKKRRRDIEYDIKDERGRTALILAAQMNRLDSIKILLNSGANPLTKDEMFSKRAIYFAAISKSKKALELLANATIKAKPTSRSALKALKTLQILKDEKKAKRKALTS